MRVALFLQQPPTPGLGPPGWAVLTCRVTGGKLPPFPSGLGFPLRAGPPTAASQGCEGNAGSCGGGCLRTWERAHTQGAHIVLSAEGGVGSDRAWPGLRGEVGLAFTQS